MTPVLLLALQAAWAAPNHVEVVSDDYGYHLVMDGDPVFVKGMNWGYMPIGENYSYDFWGQSDAFIERALRREMDLLSAMGVNSIRQYAVIPPKWVTWIYREYGITTMINPLFGRYGMMVDGRWIPQTDYSDPATRQAILDETMAAVETYKDVEGVLFFLLGNENNYGIWWKSFEIEALPKGDQNEARARYLYTLFGEAVDMIHEVDPHHPVAIANGDIQYIKLIKEEVPNLDILGGNVYRGQSSRDLFERVEEELSIPFVYTEFGSDAFNARSGREDGASQSYYLYHQWHEIYQKSYGMGEEGNAIGGYVFQWADGWWKYKQEENLDIHDTNASWPNGGYEFDYVDGKNNMNEEWFGICAKGPVKPDGDFDLYPRAAYYMLRDVFTMDPYVDEVGIDEVNKHFKQIDPKSYDAFASSGILGQRIEQLSMARVSEARLELSGLMTQTTTEDGLQAPVFEHMENLYIGVEARPVSEVRADMRLSILGNVPEERLDQLYWEAAGRDRFVEDEEGQLVNVGNLERLRVHDAGFEWNHSKFLFRGYYRQGHFHWGFEGDFFGLYREAFYGPNPDWYQANVPIGFEFEGKGKFDGLKIAAGPQIFWGANPTAIVKVREPLGPFTMTVMHQEDLASSGGAQTSSQIAEPVLRRTTAVLETGENGAGLTIGGIMAGSNKLGQDFVYTRDAKGPNSYADSGYDLISDEIRWMDTFGVRAKLAGPVGPVNAYIQGGIQGLVADAGEDRVPVFTGWRLRQGGRGNQRSVLGGMTMQFGNIQVAPSALWQKPIIGPLPVIEEQVNPETGWMTPRVVPRNFVDDPFIVRENRETLALELLLVFDPTPGSWMWQWDNFVREDAPWSAALDVVYRIQPTSTDSHIGFLANGVQFSFDDAPPAVNVLDVNSHIHWRPRGDTRFRFTGYGGSKQSSGSDDRLVVAYGGALQGWYRQLSVDATIRFNDWGPFDYYRDFNLTFPFQSIVDISSGWMKPDMEMSRSRIGFRGQYRTMDQYSPDGPTLPGEKGMQWEAMVYTHIGM